MKFFTGMCALVIVLPLLILVASATNPVDAAMQLAEAAPHTAPKAVIVEWVYRVQYGHQASGGAFQKISNRHS